MASSKPAISAPLAGQMKSTSSAPAEGGGGGEAGAGAGAGVTPGVVCVATGTAGLAGAGAGAGVPAAGRGPSVSAGADATVVPAGGTTRSTWPTSMRFGLSRLFQRAMSRQGWFTSVAMRMIVSPWRTV